MNMSPEAIRVERTRGAGLCYHVLAHLRLERDAADLYDPALPPAGWAEALAQAYARAPGRLALQFVGLAVEGLDALRAWLAAPPPELSDSHGRALAAGFAAAVERAAPAFDAGDHQAALTACAALKQPVDAFFDAVMVNAEDRQLRDNRHALLRELHQLMNRSADLAKLAM